MAISKNMLDDIDRVLLSEEEIEKRVKELAAEIEKDYGDKDVTMVCILKGAVQFYADLTRNYKGHMEMDFMSISSYGNEAKTSGIVRIAKDVDKSITDKHIIIVEDIMDSGLTLNHLMSVLNTRNPASIKIACLLDKPERRECDITPDYTGFVVPNEFVVGYGLDYAGYYRNLPYIGILKREVYSD